MTKQLLIVAIMLVSGWMFGQTPLQSFECHFAPGFTEFTPAQVDSFISKSNFDTYRLQDKRDTLAFDNGFALILFSATEMQHAGMSVTVSNYPASYPPTYRPPVFHLNPTGWITASYDKRNIKSKGR